MDIRKITFAATMLLAGLILTGCQKKSPQQKSPVPGASASTRLETNTVSRDLGAVTLTNHYETCVNLGAGKDCILTPKMIDNHNVQLTLAVESKTSAGKTHDLSVTQVVTREGKPLEVAVGDYSLSLTPRVTSE
jgi:hypothetical protein